MPGTQETCLSGVRVLIIDTLCMLDMRISIYLYQDVMPSK